MKKIFTLLLCTALFLGAFASTAHAWEETTVNTVTTVYEDGSYCVSTIEESAIITRATSTKSGSKTNRYYNSSGDLQFTVIVYGTFSYTGTSVTAIDHSYGYSITDTHWSFVSGRSYTGPGNATAYCTFHLAGSSDKSLLVTLHCSATGELS